MKIAITAQNEAGLDAPVSGHFGQAAHFALVEVTDGSIRFTETLPNPFQEGHRPGEVPAFIREHGASVILSGGMGVRAIRIFEHHEVTPVTGASGTVGVAVAAYLSGALTDSAPCADSLAHHASPSSLT